jgi:hypothetical protein
VFIVVLELNSTLNLTALSGPVVPVLSTESQYALQSGKEKGAHHIAR